MASKEALVAQIKDIQRSDPGAKQAWWDHCDAQLGGVKDPNRHDAPVLKKFIAAYSSGSLPPAGAAAWGGGGGKGFGGGGKGGGKGMMMVAPGGMWGPAAVPMWGGGGGGGGGAGSLAEFIKTGQRQSMNWKKAWHSYCTMNGGQMFDPNKYDDSFIGGFIDHVGSLAANDLALQAGQQGVDLEAALSGAKRPAPAGGGGPAKFARGGGDNDSEKAALVQQIKDLQRSDQSKKEAWWAYCDEQLGGVKDPNRHDKETLNAFIYMHQ